MSHAPTLVLPPVIFLLLPWQTREEAKPLHFIDSHRFDENFYAQQALAAIADLAAAFGVTSAAPRPERATG